MLTIGEFAQATGLTAKALRLYANLRLLPPPPPADASAVNLASRSARSAHRAGQGARPRQLDDLYPKVHRLAAQVTGQRLFVVADGFGDDDGAAGAAIDALEALDDADPDQDPLGAL